MLAYSACITVPEGESSVMSEISSSLSGKGYSSVEKSWLTCPGVTMDTEGALTESDDPEGAASSKEAGAAG